MKSPRWLLDSNVLMGFLNLDSTPGFLDRAERCIAEGSAISVITYIEVLGWRGHDAHSRPAAEQLLQGLSMIELTPAIADRTIALRSQLAIKLPDAVIAASALATRCRWSLATSRTSRAWGSWKWSTPSYSRARLKSSPPGPAAPPA